MITVKLQTFCELVYVGHSANANAFKCSTYISHEILVLASTVHSHNHKCDPSARNQSYVAILTCGV